MKILFSLQHHKTPYETFELLAGARNIPPVIVIFASICYCSSHIVTAEKPSPEGLISKIRQSII
jgi:hypothetical protein